MCWDWRRETEELRGSQGFSTEALIMYERNRDNGEERVGFYLHYKLKETNKEMEKQTS